MAEELYQRVRPRKYAEVVGQDEAIDALKSLSADKKHALMFIGPSGTGKTTLARITAEDVGCKVGSMDYTEINCGVVEPMETVRQLNQDKDSSPVGGRARVWVLDEVQALSRATFAQQALLKVLEDGPQHAYFFLCTTDPKKVLETVRNRCKLIKTKAVAADKILRLLQDTVADEELKVKEPVLKQIVEACGGSPRIALVNLEKVADIRDEDDQLRAVGHVGAEKVAFDLVKALMPFKGTASWGDVSTVLTALKESEEDPETVRQIVMASARTTLLKNGNGPAGQRAYKVIVCLEKPFWDRNTGTALLAAACYEIVFGRS